jgi:hypothetical protein
VLHVPQNETVTSESRQKWYSIESLANSMAVLIHKQVLICFSTVSGHFVHRFPNILRMQLMHLDYLVQIPKLVWSRQLHAKHVGKSAKQFRTVYRGGIQRPSFVDRAVFEI